MTLVEAIDVKEQAKIAFVAAALWTCDSCQVWWGSQATNHPDAHHLLSIVGPDTDMLLWEDYRGWRVKADEINVCPDCGRPAVFPLFSLLSQTDSNVV